MNNPSGNQFEDLTHNICDDNLYTYIMSYSDALVGE